MHRVPDRVAVALAAWLFAIDPALAQDARVARELTGKHKTAHFIVRYRKNSRAGASVDRTAVMLERDLADICKQLAFDVKKARFEIHLFDDVAELAELTGVRGAGGYSSGHRMFIPYDNDQTRYHELVHLVAFRLPRTGRNPRSLFFAEGLANALLRFVHGVHVHAVAAVELRRGGMPALTEMTKAADFYAWLRKHEGFNAYDVAASYLRFLIDTEGIAKVKKYYTGTAAKKAFGKGEPELEKAWHTMLRAYAVRPAVVTLLRKRRGEPARFASLSLAPDKRLPADVLGKPSEWRTLRPAKAIETRKHWRLDAADLQGQSTTNDWNILPLAQGELRDCVLRATVRVAEGTVGVQFQLGDRCQAMYTNAGVFLWNGGVAHQERSEALRAPRTLDFVFVRRGAKVTVYLDGFAVLSGKVTDAPGIPAVGVAGGRATFTGIRLRELPPQKR